VILVSSVGYETQEIKLNGRTDIPVQLKVAVTALQDLVVNKGYYTIKQRYNTGNVTTVKGEDIQKQPVSDPILALEGRVPGLYISQTSGIPGAYSTILLRGQNFIGTRNTNYTNNDLLYVIDGVPFNSMSLTSNLANGGVIGSPGNGIGQGMSPFNSLNPSDIESIEVLKMLMRLLFMVLEAPMALF